jgi:hypothetical protein
MHLITSFPKCQDGEINRALMRELKTGLQFKKEIERSKELQAAEQAKALVNQKEVHSKEFMKYYQKAFPHLSPNKI